MGKHHSELGLCSGREIVTSLLSRSFPQLGHRTVLPHLGLLYRVWCPEGLGSWWPCPTLATPAFTD